MKNYPGYFIVLEGTDGSGISTQIACVTRVLVEEYGKKGRKIVTTKQPSAGPVGSLIRQVLAKRLQGVDATTLALLFAADRRDHLTQEVMPILEAGGVVVCDRYLWSTLAYQGLDLDGDWLRQINRFSIVPDLTVLIKVRPGVSMKRIEAGRLRAELFEQENMLERVYSHFMTLAFEAKAAGQNVIEVDGEQSIEDVTAEIVAGVLRALTY